MLFPNTIAQALKDSGVELITYVPGYGGTSIFKAFEAEMNRPFFISYNEEVAYTVAHGAALCGTRSACLFKTHGVMKAANTLSDSLLCGTNAGLVILVAEDKGGTHSDSIIETKPFLEGIGIPNLWITPATAYEDIHRAFEMSEESGLPYALIFDADDTRLEAHFTPYTSATRVTGFQSDPWQNILSPLYNLWQRKVYLAKMRGDDWRAIPKPPLPVIPRDTSDNWKKAVEAYIPLFEIYKKYRGEVVTGDTGISSQFSADPYQCMDMVTFMGGSISLAIGAWLAGKRDVWAITGDFSFVAAGHIGLFEALLREIPLKIIILDNGKAVTTGGQAVHEEALSVLLKPYEKYIRYVEDPSDEGHLEEVLSEVKKSERLEIIRIKYTG